MAKIVHYSQLSNTLPTTAALRQQFAATEREARLQNLALYAASGFLLGVLIAAVVR